MASTSRRSQIAHPPSLQIKSQDLQRKSQRPTTNIATSRSRLRSGRRDSKPPLLDCSRWEWPRKVGSK